MINMKRLNKTQIEAEHKKLETFVLEELDVKNDELKTLVLEVANEFEITKAKATRAVKRVLERV